jgi:hypothetical protein
VSRLLEFAFFEMLRENPASLSGFEVIDTREAARAIARRRFWRNASGCAGDEIMRLKFGFVATNVACPDLMEINVEPSGRAFTGRRPTKLRSARKAVSQ